MGLIANETVTQVIGRSDIVEIIGNYTALKKAGRNFKGLCPFHNEKTPSFVVNPDKQIFHCFGCGVGGNVIGFIMRQERLEFPEAVRFLADKAGITIAQDDGPSAQQKSIRDDVYAVNKLAVSFFHEQLLKSLEPQAKAAREYLKSRGVSLETVQKFQLGFAPDEWDALLNFLRGKNIDEQLMAKAGLVIAREGKSGHYDRFRNRVIFPIFDIQSRPVAFGARAMNNEEGAKYINSPETPVYTKGQHLFGLNLTKTAAGRLDQLIVVEGYMDMIMPFIHGVEHIAASLGTALTDQQIRLIRRYTTNVVMLFDTDSAGQSAIVRSLDLLIDEGMNVKVVTLAADQDPDSFIRTYGKERFDERLANAVSLFDYKFNWLTEHNDIKTVEGKAQICQQMLSTIGHYKDEVVKYELGKQLASRLNLPEAVVFKGAKWATTPSQPPLPKKEQPKPANPKMRTVEELLLSLFLKDPAWISKAMGQITPDDFSSGTRQTVIKELWQIAQENKEVSTSDLLVRLPQDAQGLVTQLLSQEDAKLGEVDKTFDDCVRYIQKQHISRRIAEIQDAMRLAESQCNDELLEQLKHEFNTLIKK